MPSRHKWSDLSRPFHMTLTRVFHAKSSSFLINYLRRSSSHPPLSFFLGCLISFKCSPHSSAIEKVTDIPCRDSENDLHRLHHLVESTQTCSLHRPGLVGEGCAMIQPQQTRLGPVLLLEEKGKGKGDERENNYRALTESRMTFYSKKSIFHHIQCLLYKNEKTSQWKFILQFQTLADTVFQMTRYNIKQLQRLQQLPAWVEQLAASFFP